MLPGGRKMKKLEKYIKNTSFLQGFIFAFLLSSIVTFAASTISNLGYYVFQSGDPISSSEVNANFEKLGGKLIYKGGSTDSFTFDQANMPTSQLVCNASADYGYVGKLNFNADIDDYALHLNDTDTDTNNTTNGNSYSYISVPNTGWYEIRFVASPSNRNYTCTGANCTNSFETFFQLVSAKMESGSPSNSYSTITTHNSYKYVYDVDGNATLGDPTDSEIINDEVPLAVKAYLTAGDALYITFEACGMDTATATDTIDFLPGDLSLEIVQL